VDSEEAQQLREVAEAAAAAAVQIRQKQEEAELQGHLDKDTTDQQEDLFRVALVVVQELQAVVWPEMAVWVSLAQYRDLLTMQAAEELVAITVLRAERAALAVAELVRHKTTLQAAELQIPAAAVDRQAVAEQETE
jgi:apolipoprotein N-acyltransferase